MSLLALRASLVRTDFQLHIETDVPAGITGVFGPSGSGKTSLLYRIAGLARGNAADRIVLDGTTLEDSDVWLAPEQRDVSCVFQDARLFPHLSVAANLDYAYRRRRRDGLSPDQIAAMLGIESWLTRATHELSRGQQARVALARALVNAPRLLLLDEPVANIDAAGRREILTALASVLQEQSMSALLVSHDMQDLAETVEHLLVMEQGKLVAAGDLMELSSRLAFPLSQHHDAAAILEGQVRGHDRRYGLTELSLEGHSLWVDEMDTPENTPARLRLPARDVSLCKTIPADTSILNILPTTVTEIEQGDSNRVMVKLAVGKQSLLARITRKSLDALSLQCGDAVFAQIKSTALIERNDYDRL